MEEDKIRGRYELVSAVWEGDPIDLNDDGVATTDYLEEFDVYGYDYQDIIRFYFSGAYAA